MGGGGGWFLDTHSIFSHATVNDRVQNATINLVFQEDVVFLGGTAVSCAGIITVLLKYFLVYILVTVQ